MYPALVMLESWRILEQDQYDSVRVVSRNAYMQEMLYSNSHKSMPA